MVEKIDFEKNEKETGKLLEKHDSGSKFSPISPSKSVCFSGNHKYSERGDFGASSYDKKLNFDFSKKNRLF